MNALLEQIEDTLEKLLASPQETPYATLFSSARYSLLSSGKRLRPLLTLATALAYETPIEHALIPACALEMVHTYSLIHDDLPCMDDDDLRRGKPTLHKVYPEWHALLTGDYLLTYAFEVLATAPHLNADQKIDLVRSLSSRAGAHGMIGGQMIDLLSENQSIDWSTLEIMHRCKTANLIIAALEFGAIIAKAPKPDLYHLQEAGLAIGIAFQLIDDVLDVTGTQEVLGKPIGSDQTNHKATAVSLLGIPKAQSQAHHLTQKAEQHLQSLSRPAPLLHTLFHQMTHRQK